jgi:hypothetical protein
MNKAYGQNPIMNWQDAPRITAFIGRAAVSFDVNGLKPANNHADCTIAPTGYRRRLLIGT